MRKGQSVGHHNPRKPRHEVIQPADNSYRLIPLTRGQTTIVDTMDYDWLMQWSWYAKPKKNPREICFYAERARYGGGNICMAREILGCKDGEESDHINHNPLDNRRCNLRKVTHIENLYNRRKHWNNRSGYKGVSFNQGAWIAHVGTKYLGRFSNPEEASKAYKIAVALKVGAAYLCTE